MDNLSEKHNAIIGRNGTGKSNFFDAIRFVLCDEKFYNMSHAERQHLLYEGPGPTDILSSYVEIHFDNSDNRFPIDREEVVLRRSIGLKKDEYFLNKKHVTKQDVLSLLESAGFSRANPYYIVQQGRVNALTLMKDEQRLDLLKEVAGTKVYEQRRGESMKIIKETEGKLVKVHEVLRYIEERLTELEEEKEELEQYRQLDKERRAIEYAYYDNQYTQANERLEACEAERMAELERANDVHDVAAEAREEMTRYEAHAAALRAAHTRALAEQQAADEERRELRGVHAQLRLTADEAASERASGSKERKAMEKELKQLLQTIKTSEKKLAAAAPETAAATARESELRARLAEIERRLTELYGKEGRSEQFRSKKERDAWIDGEVARMQEARAQHDKQIALLESEQAKGEAALAQLNERVASHERGVQERRAALEEATQKLADHRMQRDTLAAERKELWRADARVEAELAEQRAALSSAERTLDSSVARGVAQGIDAVRRIVAEHRMQGVYGPLIELITVKAQFATAVEVAARGSLFNIVVETDKVAADILEIFNQERVKGRVSFLPLNRVKASEREYPSSPDVRPLVNEIQCDAKFDNIVRHVFGKTLVCRNLEVASMNAKQHRLDCITLDGDQVERKGALTGGFSDPKRSWLASMETVKEARAKLSTLGRSHGKHEQQLRSLDARVTELLGDIERRETEVVTLRNAIDQLMQDLRSLARERSGLTAAIEQRDGALLSLRGALAPLAANVDALRAERGSPLHASLGDAERDELRTLLDEQSSVQHEAELAAAARVESARVSSALTALLDSNLRRRHAELQAKLEELNLAELAAGGMEPIQHELQLVEQTLRQLDERCAELEESIASRSEEQKEVESAIAALQSNDGNVSRKLLDESKQVERLLQQRSLLLRQRDEYARKIRELGSLPEASLAAKLAKLSQKQLLQRLRSVNEKLRKYSHVNKKAADQYVNFTDQRDSLLGRKKELDDGAEAIHELIDSLDRKKDEAIERTFKGVAKHFRVVFRDLVPSGTASLIMQTRDPSSLNDSASMSQSQASQSQSGSVRSRISRYSGIGIKVSFAEGSETVHIQQLSGGQKSLVALALIFAIQRSDPAPFYMFDEIDSALDTTYRSSVATMIKEQSKDTQFITTTFKPELVEKARKFYGISFTKQKISRINVIDRATALSSIAEEQQREQELAR